MKRLIAVLISIGLIVFMLYSMNSLEIVEYKFEETSYTTINSGSYDRGDQFISSTQQYEISEEAILEALIYPYYYGDDYKNSVATIILLDEVITVHHIVISDKNYKISLDDFKGQTILVSLPNLQLTDQWCMKTKEGQLEDVTFIKQILHRKPEDTGVYGGDTLRREIFRIDLSNSFRHRYEFYNATTFNDFYKEMKFTLEIK
jgi:hypothetical protein